MAVGSRAPLCTAVLLVVLLALGSASAAAEAPEITQYPTSTAQTRPPAADDPSSWVVLLTVNSGFYDFFRNWLLWYRRLGSPYSVRVVPEDQEVLDLLVKANYSGVTVHIPETSQVDGATWASHYGTRAFKLLVAKRASHMLELLRAGRKIIYTDADTAWLADPTPFFQAPYEMWALVEADRGGQRSLSPWFCTGLIAALPTARVIAAMQAWEKALTEGSPQPNQPIFNNIVHWPAMKNHIAPLPRDRFPSGTMYFDLEEKAEDHVTRQAIKYDRRQALIVHNNNIGQDRGYPAKLERWKKYNLWLVKDA
eukprot:TRINITY_DN61072_c0_g1_i1.p1 TRINITY_DN61072_c0_g1~~TRINITY_DN61072_c0_g1_i1.p1  ORF type:complete len:310 (+),score=59.75 TRINITY_DN61072_c0_g1_i1:96-1025(+)